MKINDYDFPIEPKVQELLNDYNEQIYAPKKNHLFRALELCPLKETKVVILGQDPYPTAGDACGLSFSVDREEKLPKSMINMYKELSEDLNINRTSGDLTDWAKQGVLLLNTVLTVEIGNANSHRKLGWQTSTDAIIEQVNNQGKVVFVLLGKQAQDYEKVIDTASNTIIKLPHPSPLSAYRGFFGSKLYSKVNVALKNYGHAPINW